MWINTDRSLTVYLLFCRERASGEKVNHCASCSSAEWLKTSQKSTPETASRELARSYDALANGEEALAMVDLEPR
jgi:hypothetical protein